MASSARTGWSLHRCSRLIAGLMAFALTGVACARQSAERTLTSTLVVSWSRQEDSSFNPAWLKGRDAATVWRASGDVGEILRRIQRSGGGTLNFPVAGGTPIPFDLHPIKVAEPTASLANSMAFRGIRQDDPHDVLRVVQHPVLGMHIAAIINDQLYYHQPKPGGPSDDFILYPWSRVARPPAADCTVRGPTDFIRTVPISVLPDGTADGPLTIPVRQFETGVLLTASFVNNSSGSPEFAYASAFRALQFASQVFEREAAIEIVPVMSKNLVSTAEVCENKPTNEQRLKCGDTVIVNALPNVDLGHMFIGGATEHNQAVIGSACGLCKGCGMTTFVGDIYPASVDTLIHEIAHQLGALHSFNGDNKNRDPQGGFEPGLGSTVMSYAHLGRADSVQDYRDQYFHAGSINQMLAKLPKCDTSPLACGCTDTLASTQKPPAISALPRLVALHGTAFRLNANVHVAGPYRARWEEIDQGLATDSIPPFYRSHSYSSPNRTFPTWDRIWNGNYHDGDLLFDECTKVTRETCTLRFQLTARADDRRVASMHATTIDVLSAGPFKVEATALGGGVHVTWWIEGARGSVPRELYRTVQVKIGKGPGDVDWHEAGTTTIDAGQFTIQNVPFPNGTDLRVLVEATNGSYLALSGTVTLK